MKHFPTDFKLKEGVWFPLVEDSIPYSDGDAAETYLAETLANAGNLSSDSAELIQSIKDWPSRYHLSPERANLLRSLGISRGARVLELGSGCGAITRFLGENAGRVTAVEGSPVRARLARLRCGDLDNVDLIAGNFDDIVFDGPFDIVTLVGVLEYAAIFWRQSGDPFEGMLRLAWQNLSENGALIIAIENRLGVKYLSGCAEDHTSRLFNGIEGYPDHGGPRTFGRQELIDLATRCGFVDYDLILPFPDYKIPNTVINGRFTSARECREYNLVDWCRQPFQDYGKEREYLFSDHLALASAAESGLLADYANSFLLVAGKTPFGAEAPIRRADWIAKKFNMLRRPPYQTVTTLTPNGENVVIAKELVNNLPPPDSSLVKIVVEPESDFIRCGTSLSQRMLRALRRNSGVEQEFTAIVSLWVEYLRKHLIAGTVSLPPSFVDCIPDNLILDQDGRLHYIDDEWHWREPVSLDWILFRGLLGFWLGCKPWVERSLVPQEYRFSDFLSRALGPSGAAVDPEALPALAGLEAKFQREVVTSQPIDYEALLQNVYREKPSLHHVEGLLSELNQAGKYIDTCHSTIEEKDTTIHQVAGERTRLEEEVATLQSGLLRSNQECQYLGGENEKLQKQLSLQLQKTKELNALAERLRAGATVTPLFSLQEPGNGSKVLDIIIPVYNAYQQTRACINSVIKHTDPRHRIVVIDDASADARIRPYLEAQAERYPQILLFANEANQGFIKTVNAALAGSERDVIVLNSDTIVTAGWAEKIITASQSHPTVGLVCPLSNNATIVSVPNMNEDNRLPSGMSIDQFARLVGDVSLKRYPVLPTVIGFCMYVSRKCLNDVGLLDEVFGMGYGEENDLAMRAQAKGYTVVAADDAFVYHSGSVSFKTVAGDLDERKVANEGLLGQRWPNYHQTIFAFCVVNPLREIQQRIHDGLHRWIAGDKPHIMQVLHSFHAKAGTELHTFQLATGLTDFFRTTVFFPDQAVADADAKTYIGAGGMLELRYSGRNMASDIAFGGVAGSTASTIVEMNFERILRSSDIHIVHFQHLLLYGTFNLPFIAKSLGRRVAVTLHDYFYLCPVYNLIKADGGGMCGYTGPDIANSDCRRCFEGRFRSEKLQDAASFEALQAAYIAQRRVAAMKALDAADVVIAPSQYVKDKHAAAFGPGIGDKIIVIGHGVPVPPEIPSTAPRKQIRVTFLGNATKIKGFEVFGDAAIRLKHERVIMQAFGGADERLVDRYRGSVKLKGAYQPGDLPEIMRQSDVVVIPSIWEETFCLTLSEAIAHGIPVIASDVGAMSERIEEGKNGFLFPVGNVSRLTEIISKLVESPQMLRQIKEYCRANPPRTIEAMIESYRELYDDLACGRAARLHANNRDIPRAS